MSLFQNIPEKNREIGGKLLQIGYNLYHKAVKIRKTVDNPAVLRYIIIVVYLHSDLS